MVYSLVGLAAVTLEGPNPEESVRMLSAVDRLARSAGLELQGVEQDLLDRTRSGVRAVLGDGFDRAWEIAADVPVFEIIASILYASPPGEAHGGREP